MQFHWEDSFPARSCAEGISEICRIYGVRPDFFTLLDCSDEKLFRHLSEFDGILVKHNFRHGDERLRRIGELAEKVPMVWFGVNGFNRRFPNVVLDNHAAGALAAEELIRRGHRVIAFISTDPDHGMFAQRRNRIGIWRGNSGEFFFEKERAPPESPGRHRLPESLRPLCEHSVIRRN